ncbi:MAG: hypothetical protein IT376_02765 [Polyangiaceae bacterium]|nr:hypothetical protein [Polyangiaceae bacterium]
MPEPITSPTRPRTPEEAAGGAECAPDEARAAGTTPSTCEGSGAGAPPAPEPELSAGASALVAARSSKRRESASSTTGPTATATHESDRTTASVHLYRDESSSGTLTLGGGRLQMSERGPEVEASALRLSTPVTDGVEVEAQILSGGVVATAGEGEVAVGAQVNLAQWQATWATDRGSVTVGASIGAGFALQTRLADTDGDGKADGVCYRVEVGPFILGGCNPPEPTDPAAQGGTDHPGNVPEPDAAGAGGAPAQ